MRAITYDQPGDPDVLRWGEVDEPAAGDGELLIEVAAAGVNRADLMQRRGHYPPPPGASPLLGLEVSGRVAALGSGDTGSWSVGDHCVALLAGGGYAERVAVPAGQALPLPDGVDLITAGGLIEVAATVVSNVEAARLQPGETLLVHGGAGGIGSFAIPYAASLGMRVIATAGTTEKLAYCRALGADLAVSYRGDWLAEVRAATDGRGPDVILDVMGASYLAANVDVLAVGGRLVVIGLQGGRRATLDLGQLLAKRASVAATALRSRPVAEKAAICRRVRETVWPLLSAGRLEPTRQTRFALADAADAHRRLESGENVGKIVLTRD